MAARGTTRIENHTAALMIAVAAFFDGLQLVFIFIPVVNVLLGWLINLFALMTFGLWFAIQGNIFSRNPVRKGLLGAGTAMFEMIAGFLPTWTMYVTLTIWMARKEDVEEEEQRAQQLQQWAQRQQKGRKQKKKAANDNVQHAAA